MNLDIIYQDEHLVAINKPHGLLVHKSKIASNTTLFAVQLLRDQLGCYVSPIHRLDRKTGGVLLFALNQNIVKTIQSLFVNRQITKKYLAILRGYSEVEGEIDYPLKKENGAVQDAYTKYRTLLHTEINIPFGKHLTSRYSLVEAHPTTGRMHQLRKHFAHILHPIVGDRPYGCNKQNKLFKERWNMETMLLHASSLSFTHPLSDKEINIEAPLQPEFVRMLEVLKLNFKS